MKCSLAVSVRRHGLVLLLTFALAASGLWSLSQLPIDAMPDITNVQVEINFAPALSPLEIEKQVTFPLEVALADIPGIENTWSFSRNGFAQVTAVFTDRTDIYFARQQVNERLGEARSGLPPGVEVRMGPISTGLGEVYWWSVEYEPPLGARASRPPFGEERAGGTPALRDGVAGRLETTTIWCGLRLKARAAAPDIPRTSCPGARAE